MKKLLVASLTLMGTFGFAKAANVLTVHNLTPCPYTLSTSGGYLMIGPGTTTFNSPSTLNFEGTKIMYVAGWPNDGSIGVGIGTPYANSMGMPTPACLTTSTFITASWSQASPAANATLVIF
ncbi:hypothetical protein [Taibaiella sp. KBW10]|uniref:hypothetical protein n=1 Tax=Taibaiella sp. KBW10 TaxID=2153357 RepID=UPI000F597143|nr:hypothetical protein [Taibaiella sp. KBW10]